MLKIKLLSGIVLLLMITGCSSVPVSTMWELRNFDLVTTDVAKLRIGVRAPVFMRITENATRLELGLSKKDNTFKHKEVTHLQHASKGTELASLQRYRKAGYKLHVFKLTDEGLKKVARFRRHYQALKKEFGDDVAGSLSVSAGGCLEAESKGKPIKVTTFMKSSETGKFVILTNEQDLRTLTGDNKLNICGKT